MVERNGRDRDDRRGGNDIGRVEPAAEPRFQQHDVGRRAHESAKGRRRRDLEKGDRVAAVGALAFFEERDLLLARLLEAKTYRDVSNVFGTLIDLGMARFGREVGFGGELAHLVPDPLSNIGAGDLAAAYERALRATTPEALSTHHVTPLPKMSVVEAREILLNRLLESRNNSFEVVTSLASSKIEVVLYFLGLLELYKLGLIDAVQNGMGAITIEVIGDRDQLSKATRA